MPIELDTIPAVKFDNGAIAWATGIAVFVHVGVILAPMPPHAPRRRAVSPRINVAVQHATAPAATPHLEKRQHKKTESLSSMPADSRPNVSRHRRTANQTQAHRLELAPGQAIHDTIRQQLRADRQAQRIGGDPSRHDADAAAEAPKLLPTLIQKSEPEKHCLGEAQFQVGMRTIRLPIPMACPETSRPETIRETP